MENHYIWMCFVVDKLTCRDSAPSTISRGRPVNFSTLKIKSVTKTKNKIIKNRTASFKKSVLLGPWRVGVKQEVELIE